MSDYLIHKTHEYVLNIDEKDVTIKYLQDLVGLEFPILAMGRSWGEDVIEKDYVKMTHVKVTTLLKPEIDVSAIMIYSDFYLKGALKYNAWTGLETYKKWINAYIQKQVDNETTKEW